jgi:hypothetical protein
MFMLWSWRDLINTYLGRYPGAACAAEHDKTYMCIFTIWSEMHMKLALAMSELTAA